MPFGDMARDHGRAAAALMRPAARVVGAALVAAAILGLSLPLPARAIDLFARHEVTLQFATPDGKPLADAEVRVFAPGAPGKPALTGRTDSQGKFEFAADADGFWSAEARSGSEIDRVMVRVGADAARPDRGPLSPYWIIGGLALLLGLVIAVRMARSRLMRRRE